MTKKIEDGGPAWMPIETADKDADRMLLGIVRNDVLEEVHIGGFRYAINEDEVSCWWSDQADDEIVPTHWLDLELPSTLAVCSDCPPAGYPTDITRCCPCPRKSGGEA